MTVFLNDVILNVAVSGVVSDITDQLIRYGMVNRVIDNLVIGRLTDLLAVFLTLLMNKQELELVSEHCIDHDLIPFFLGHESQFKPICLKSAYLSHSHSALHIYVLAFCQFSYRYVSGEDGIFRVHPNRYYVVEKSKPQITARRCTMAIVEVKRIPTANKPDKNYIEDPNIVKVAKLALILAYKDTNISEKLLCVKAAERFGIITEEEATQLLLY